MLQLTLPFILHDKRLPYDRFRLVSHNDYLTIFAEGRFSDRHFPEMAILIRLEKR